MMKLKCPLNTRLDRKNKCETVTIEIKVLDGGKWWEWLMDVDIKWPVGNIDSVHEVHTGLMKSVKYIFQDV